MTLYNVLEDNISREIERVSIEKSEAKADWGISSHPYKIGFDAINALQFWPDLGTYKKSRVATQLAMEAEQRKRGINKRIKMYYKGPFQLPLFPASEFSINFGVEHFSEQIYAIDGGDQGIYELTRGIRGGTGMASCGWVAMQNGNKLDQFPTDHRASLQTVPAEAIDAQNFSYINFNEYINSDLSSLSVRRFAALRRQQLEFLLLNDVVDRAEPGSIILLDGFLRAVIAPPTWFIHHVGKKATQRNVVVLGVAKDTKINMWLHFQELWNLEGLKNCWIRPPAPILDDAYRSISAEDSSQYLHLGSTGRGIGIPIATALTALRKKYYVVDFNCYDFEGAKRYLRTDMFPEVHSKYFPLTTKDKDFISGVLARLAAYSEKITYLGYPFPTALAHNLVKITRFDVETANSLVKSKWLSNDQRLDTLRDFGDFADEPHKTLDSL